MDIKRCGLFVLSLGVSFIGLSGLLSDSASAWTQDPLPICTDFAVPEFNSLLEADPRYDEEKTQWITFVRNHSTPFGGGVGIFVYWDYEDEVSSSNTSSNYFFDDDYGNYVLDYQAITESTETSPSNAYRIIDPVIGSPYLQETTFGTSGTRGQLVDIYCIEQLKNPLYSDEYINAGGNTYDERTVSQPVETIPNLYPHFAYLVTDKEIKANNDLTQELPELPEPDEGWQNAEWQIMWYLFKCSSIDYDNLLDCEDREMINSDLLLRDEEYNWEVDEYGDYLLVAEFRYRSCYRYGSWPATPDHCILSSEHDEYSFVPGRTVPLDIDGNNIVGNTANLNCDVAGYCYDDTRFKNCNVVVAIATLSFDDFNYADCLENISLLADMLSFGTLKFSNSWVSNGNCYTLGTLGNWLNVDNKLVCPYFSNEVRNTITPFITFLLGLIMIRFIAGKGTHGSREVDI